VVTAFGHGMFPELVFYCPRCNRSLVTCHPEFNCIVELDDGIELYVGTPICKGCGEMKIMLYKDILLIDFGLWSDVKTNSFGMAFDPEGST
jgi:RNase P subunit RPR2